MSINTAMLADAVGGVDWYFNGLLGLTRGVACVKGRTKVLPKLYGAELLKDGGRMYAGACASASEGRDGVAEAR